MDKENIQHKYEAKENWGDTEEYKQSIDKTSQYTKEDWDAIYADKDRIFNGFAQNMDKDVSSPDVVELVIAWQEHITKYYYECSNEMLAGLADMYINDARYKDSIDQYKKGLAEFISDAIRTYYLDMHP
ncbi:MAG: TipAS antibiotic-recognition domain-containing protein [Clostridiales bacterium]|nr:TipAS antibiotic-recognition domain-containing protein [Clostridiales bacterium]